MKSPTSHLACHNFFRAATVSDVYLSKVDLTRTVLTSEYDFYNEFSWVLTVMLFNMKSEVQVFIANVVISLNVPFCIIWTLYLQRQFHAVAPLEIRFIVSMCTNYIDVLLCILIVVICYA